MKLTHLRVRNCLSFGDATKQIDFGKFNTIVGPNDSGKTTILRAISFVRDAFEDRSIDVKPYYHNGDVNKSVEVEIDVTFTNEEIQGLSDFLFCTSILESVPKQQQENEEFVENLKRIAIYEYGKAFRTLFQNVSIGVRCYSQFVPPQTYVRLLKSKQELFIQEYGYFTKTLVPFRSGTSHNLAVLLVDELRSKYSNEVQLYTTGQVQGLPPLDFTPPDLFDVILRKLEADKRSVVNVGGCNLADMRHRVADDLVWNRLIRFLRERGFKEAAANLFDVLKTILNHSLIRISDIRSRPQSFLPMTEELEAVSVQSLLSGEELPLILFKLKNSSNPRDKERYRKIERTFAEFKKGLSFDVAIRGKKISEAAQNTIVGIPSSSLRTELFSGEENLQIPGIRQQQKASQVYELFIQFLKDYLSVPIDFAAAGIFEILLLLTAIIGHTEKIILLDEPALNLHPTFQLIILDHLRKTTEENANQVILVTHSPYLVCNDNINNTWRLAMGDEGTEIYNLGETIKQFEENDRKRLIIQLNNADIRALLFSCGIVLVEGPSDKIVVESIDRYLSLKGKGAGLETNEWQVISVGGKKSFNTFVRLAQTFKIPFISVMDYDALMHCDAEIRMPDNTTIRTSSILFNLYKIGLLKSAELKILKDYEKSAKSIQGAYWYAVEYFNPLIKLIDNSCVYIFKTDLEGVLQTPTTKRESKPLKAFEAVLRKIEDDDIPEEFYNLANFIRQRLQ